MSAYPLRAEPGETFRGEPVTSPAKAGVIPPDQAPARPTLIRPLPQKPLQADSLDALARHVHALRGARGLRIGPLLNASHGGSDTFPCFSLYAIDPDSGTEEWLGSAAVQSARPDALKDALRRAAPMEVANG